MKNQNENNIIFYRSWWDSLVSKSPDFRHRVIDAVFAFAFEEKEPDFPKESGLQIAYENITSIISQNREEYTRKKSEALARWQARSRNVTARSEKKVNVKDKDKISEEIVSLSLPQKEIKENSPVGDAERERVIFDYALFLLTEGRVTAYSNAVAAWEYNQALGWVRDTERKDGSVVHQPIRYRLSWLKNREQKPPQEFEAPHGKLLADILRRTGMLPENAAIIDLFRGCAFRTDTLYFIYTSLTPAVRSFATALDKNPKINTIVSQEIAKVFPDIQSFAVIKKSDL